MDYILTVGPRGLYTLSHLVCTTSSETVTAFISICQVRRIKQRKEKRMKHMFTR